MTVHLDVQLLTIAVSMFIPLLVGLLTKSAASRTVKTVLNLALSSITAGLVIAINAGGEVAVVGWGVNVLLAFGTSLAAHYNVWKPTGATAGVQNIAPTRGLGSYHGAVPE